MRRNTQATGLGTESGAEEGHGPEIPSKSKEPE